MEILGTLTLQHQPEQVSITAELNELSQIQNQLSEKQTTLSSLQQTSGSKEVVKQMKQEISQLQTRQKELMVAIGVKADAARPDLPGAAGNYGAIDQLRATIQPKQAELEQLQAEIGPIADKETISSAGSLARKYAPISIGAIAAVLILYFGIGWVWGLFSSAGWKEFQYYIPDDVKSFTYANLKELREHEHSEDLADLSNYTEDQWLATAIKSLNLDEDEIEQLITIDLKDSGTVVVLKTAEDYELEDIIKSTKGNKTETTNDIEYVILQYGSLCVARTEKNTFCLAGRKDSMEEEIKHFRREKKPEFDEDFQEALHDVEMFTEYAVTLGSRSNPTSSNGARIETGWIFNDSIVGKGIKIFEKESEAEEAYEDEEKIHKRAIEDTEDKIERTKDKDLLKALKGSLFILKATDIDLDGNKVTTHVKYDVDDLEEFK